MSTSSIYRNAAMGVVMISILSIQGQAATTEPIPVQTGVAQLFVDDYLIGAQTDLVRTLRQPKKDHDGNLPIIPPPKDYGEFPATHQANGSIVYDPNLKKYVMFALACALSDRSWERVRLYRYSSDDYMNWEGGERIFPMSREDFLHPETGEYASNMDLFSCYYDKTDSDYPYKGWLWYANWGLDHEGIYLVKSKDGIKWERGQMLIDGYGSDADTSCKRLTQDGREMRGAGDVTTFYHDEQENRFLGLFKFFGATEVEHKNRLRSRAYAFMDRMDEPFDIQSIEHIELLPAAAEKNGDMPHDEYYASTAWRYESLWLGGLKVWHGLGDYPYSPAGSAFMKLAVSRDGLDWEKVRFKNDDGIPEVFVPNGPEGHNNGQNDGGYITEFSTPPKVIGDELIYYYGASSWGKNHPGEFRVTGGGVFRARLRIDGFVSVDGGSLTTKPLAFEGSRLTLNSNGPIQVEAIGADGKVLGSAAVKDDSLANEVSFDGKGFGEIAAGKPVQLRFTVPKGGSLYSFTIRDK